MTAGVKVTVRDKGAEKLLSNLLKKGALSVGVLAEDAGQSHKQSLSATDKKRLEHAKRLAKGGFKSSREEIKRLNGKKNTAGELTIGEIAAIHEFGLGTAPRRSFLADWAEENRDKIARVVIKGGQALAARRFSSPIQFLEQLGAWSVGQVQKRMASNIPPPLSPSTIKRKGSSVALIDTGQLRSSISYRVDAVQTAKGVQVKVRA